MVPPDFIIQPAHHKHLSAIVAIIDQAIQKRKEEGSDQWQNGYSNEQVIAQDIAQGAGLVLVLQDEIVAYMACLFDGEQAYESIDGKWLSSLPYACVHRLAVKQRDGLKGCATAFLQKLEPFCLNKGYTTIKLDTNFDNQPMLHLLDKMGYTYCGEVHYPEYNRQAFEKLL